MNWAKVATDMLKAGSKPRRRVGASRPRGPRKPWWWGVVALVIAGGSYLYKEYGAPKQGRDPAASPPPVVTEGSGDSLAELIRQKRSDVPVQLSGEISRLLADDNDGSRHQKFIVRVAGGQTVMVAHNIDVAPRVPATVGMRVSMKGEYVWNEQGGLIHWTHHDPAKLHPGGWIEVNGKRFE